MNPNSLYAPQLPATLCAMPHPDCAAIPCAALLQDVAMNPNSLYATRGRGKQPANPHARRLDVEADLKPVVDFLTGTAGLSTEQVAKVRC